MLLKRLAGSKRARCLLRLSSFAAVLVLGFAPCAALTALVASKNQGMRSIAAACGDGAFGDVYPVMGEWQVVATAAGLLACLPAIGAVAILVTRPWTRHLRLALFYSLIVYAGATSNLVTQASLCDLIDDRPLFGAVHVACPWVEAISFMAALVVFLNLVYYRILALEWVMQKDLETAYLKRLLHLAGLMACLGVFLICFRDVLEAFEARWLGRLSNVVGSLLALVAYIIALRYMWYSIRAFSTPLCQLQRRSIHEQLPEVRQAVAIASLQRNAIVASFATSALVLLVYFVRRPPVTDYSALGLFMQSVVESLDSFVKAFGVILTSGVLQANSKTCDAAAFEKQRAWRQMKFFSHWSPHPDGPWQESVEALACRGVSLRALLEFYEALPSVMPHYEPRVHTTADVVRGAIIPLTRDKGLPCSTHMMHGRMAFPRTMVTHVWSGLFSELVGSIAAHALNEPCYGLVTALLRTDLQAVRSLLEAAGKLEETVWVCAFSVNQHRSICDQVSTTVDPITGQPHPICPCTWEKYLNGTAPLRKDGKSIPCEMNKFADMISFLASRDPGFKHLIIVDPGASIFTRAWCMKEAQVGYYTGTCQTMLVPSPESLAESYSKLSQSRIEDMQASRCEDISEILQSIPDTAAFNRALRDLIFSNAWLFGKVMAGDTAVQMSRVGWIARWLPLVESADESVQEQFFQRLSPERWLPIRAFGATSSGSQAAGAAPRRAGAPSGGRSPRDGSKACTYGATTARSLAATRPKHAAGFLSSQG